MDVYWLRSPSRRAADALPASWVSISVRNSKDTSVAVDTIVILPIVVTSIIIIGQNSLVWPSPRGIAAAVRFRNSLKSSGTLVLLLAVGIGVRSIGALELAIVLSGAFNYVFLILWVTAMATARHQEALHDQLRPYEAPPERPPRDEAGARRLAMQA